MNYLTVKKASCEKFKFHLPPKYLYYATYVVNFELFYRNIRNIGILSNKDLDLVKARNKEASLSSYQNYNNDLLQYLSKEEFLGIQNLRKNKNIVIQKSERGNSVVIFNKADYLDKMENLLSGTHKLEKNILKNDRIMSLAVNQ